MRVSASGAQSRAAASASVRRSSDLQLAPSIGRALGLREREKLVREAARAHRRAVHALDLAAHVVRKLAPQQQFEMHLQAGERRTQLVRRVGEKSLLHRVRFAQAVEQAIEGVDHRRDLDRRRGALRQRPQVARTAAHQLGAQVLQRDKAPADAEPRERGRHDGDEQRRSELRREDLSDEAIALVQRLADLDHEIVGRAQRRDADFLAAVSAVEEDVLARHERRRRRQVRRRRR